jgi:hypothetical protein
MRMLSVLLALYVTAVQADPGDFRTSVDSPRPESSEDSALQGFILLKENAAGSRAVGAVGRAYSVSRGANNTIWGMVTEAVHFNGATGNAVGLETAVANLSPDNAGQLRGIDVVFKNRMDSSLHEPVAVVGQNGFNLNSAAVYISSQPRSSAGEFSGWQAGIRFDRSSLDRSSAVPWTAAIDLSEVETPAALYLIVWRCGVVKCGLKPTETGAVIVADIDKVHVEGPVQR